MLLHILKNGKFYKAVFAGNSVKIGDIGVLSPAVAGWKYGDYEIIVAPKKEVVEPVITIEVKRSYMFLSFTQLIIGLVTEKIITEEDGDNWISGTLPKIISSAIEKLPKNNRFSAKVKALRGQQFNRTEQLTKVLSEVLGLSDDTLDKFFTTYESV